MGFLIVETAMRENIKGDIDRLEARIINIRDSL